MSPLMVILDTSTKEWKSHVVIIYLHIPYKPNRHKKKELQIRQNSVIRNTKGYLQDETSYMGQDCRHDLLEQSTWSLPTDAV